VPRSKLQRLAYAIFNVKNPAILNIAWGNLGDLTKRRHLSAHFGLKYLSNDGINRDRFHCKNFPEYILFGQLKKSRANFEWSVPLTYIPLRNPDVAGKQRNGGSCRRREVE